MATKDHFWLKTINRALYDLDETPLFRPLNGFNLDEIANSIKETFGLSKLKIDIFNTEWKEVEEIEDGFGEDIIYTPLQAIPLMTPIYFLMNKNDIEKLTSFLISEKQNVEDSTSDIFKESFYKYITLETLSILEEAFAKNELSLMLKEADSKPKEDCICYDIKIHFGSKKSVWSRLVLPKSFRDEYEQKFKNILPPFPIEKTKDLDVKISLRGGETQLSIKDYQNLNVGDFVILDSITFDPSHNKHIVTMSLSGIDLFQAKINEEQIKILDFTHYSEVNEDMDDVENTHSNDIIEEAKEVKEEPTSIENTPITVTIEIAKIKITLDKLLKLQPGNFLEIPLNIESGVNLVVNGKKVGKAELVNIGEGTGIRILEFLK